MGMLVVRVLLIVVEEYYGQAKGASGGNKVACSNRRALLTFAKKSIRIPVVSCNADVQRALSEVNQRSGNSFTLEHMKCHQDRNKKVKTL